MNSGVSISNFSTFKKVFSLLWSDWPPFLLRFWNLKHMTVKTNRPEVFYLFYSVLGQERLDKRG